MSIVDIPSKTLKMAQTKINNFLWNNKKAKVKHSTLIASYKEGGLKASDLESQNKALRLAWLKRLYKRNRGVNLLITILINMAD